MAIEEKFYEVHVLTDKAKLIPTYKLKSIIMSRLKSMIKRPIISGHKFSQESKKTRFTGIGLMRID